MVYCQGAEYLVELVIRSLPADSIEALVDLLIEPDLPRSQILYAVVFLRKTMLWRNSNIVNYPLLRASLADLMSDLSYE